MPTEDNRGLVMLVEDEVLTGAALVDLIEDVGHVPAGPFARCSTAVNGSLRRVCIQYRMDSAFPRF
jgi:hypothetical protein